jgi:formylglycine-generating enzyme required for sulfatase activity
MKKYFLCIAILIAINRYSYSNNVNITNVSAPSSTTIQFNISWDNSWFTAAPSNNWDAVWIFVKTQACATGSSPWVHANLSNSSVNHSVTGGVLQVDAVTDGRGVFLRRSSLGVGNIPVSTVTLTFSGSYTVANTNYEVIGIEMVQVPQGAFTAGDGSFNTSFSVNSYSLNGLSTTPHTVSSEGSIAGDILRNDNTQSASGITTHGVVPAAFPKGFNAFYCMKYEISQQQYVAFLNLLDFSQQINRTAVIPSSVTGTAALAPASGDNRNSIEISTPGVAFSTPAIYGNDLNGNNIYNEAGDGGNIACNYLSWEDLKAYLDWAALRPMTELEFEKACKGPNTILPALAEFAWGNTTINQAISSSLSNGGLANEVSTSTADGLCAQNGGASTTLGPLRVGFAATSTTIRAGAGASFYGILDLSGNVWEQTYTTGYNTGTRLAAIFNGTLGDGTLDLNGMANQSNWNGLGANQAIVYSIVRGGNWEYSAQRAQVADRFFLSNTTENLTRVRRTGGRGVR